MVFRADGPAQYRIIMKGDYADFSSFYRKGVRRGSIGALTYLYDERNTLRVKEAKVRNVHELLEYIDDVYRDCAFYRAVRAGNEQGDDADSDDDVE